ncbi:DUF5916 domain-containing protein [Polaribacter ponticola]|uniref:DUF5916 domain-containing protein n=1 Tax=Polaribacter ponticola TaxID=2978475 RepID=A0ABT5S4U2_9FLAO|nr:DUF5916 domain-containing protein [Polaribacter sp. MSW5]MDD7913124.1 DUF5916 domain-containing protein [Polaribacter sp. MSW5]
MKNTLLFFLLSLIYIQSYSQNNQSKIVKINENIKIDGKLNESVWKKSTSFNQFYNHFPNDSGLVKKPVIAKAFHNGNTLYIGVTIFEDTPEYIVRSLKRDEGFKSFTNGDGFGIVIDVNGNQNSGYLFAVNVKGVQTDGIISITNDNYSVDSNWNTKWQSKTIIQTDKRYYEIAIPLNALPYNIKNKKWGINFMSIDAKTPQYATLTSYSRNYSVLDLRFTKPIEIENLTKTKASKSTLIPSSVYSYNKNVTTNKNNSELTAGLDLKYKVTSSLKLDVTINPDFSAIEQDQQITNLTRFDISFPEQRNFFLENGDLFNNLGTRGINPFYSRIIGSKTDIQFGLKLSGKLTDKLRIGFLNSQTESNDTENGQNYTVVVGRRKISKTLTTTAYFINRQELKKHQVVNDYNRVVGINFNYISNDNKWLGQFNYGKSLTSGISKNNDFYNATLSYSSRKWLGTSSTSLVNKNYITNVGFVPRLNNFDAILKQSTKDGYLENYTEVIYNNYKPSSNTRDKNEHKIRFNTFLNSNLKLIEEDIELVNIWRYKDLSYFFLNVFYNHNNLQFATDILRNGTPILKDIYNTTFIRFGYISPPTNKAFSFQNRFQYGSFYNGDRFRWEFVANYRLQPWANFSADYNLNIIDLKQYGEDTIHALNFKGSIFFTNKLSWTTIAQLNTQNENLGFNTRLQWEFNPLSFAHLVISNNYNVNPIDRQSYSIALKVNYWLDL